MLVIKEYQGEHPVVVVTNTGSKIQGCYTMARALEIAKAGTLRHILIRKNGMWVKHATYARGLKRLRV